jgi:Lon protease-like protein
MSRAHLTGEYRFRTLSRVFAGPLLVLQVEEWVPDGPPDGNGLREWLEGYRWRDAKIEDLEVILGTSKLARD